MNLLPKTKPQLKRYARRISLENLSEYGYNAVTGGTASYPDDFELWLTFWAPSGYIQTIEYNGSDPATAIQIATKSALASGVKFYVSHKAGALCEFADLENGDRIVFAGIMVADAESDIYKHFGVEYSGRTFVFFPVDTGLFKGGIFKGVTDTTLVGSLTLDTSDVFTAAVFAGTTDKTLTGTLRTAAGDTVSTTYNGTLDQSMQGSISVTANDIVRRRWSASSENIMVLVGALALQGAPGGNGASGTFAVAV